MSIGQYSNYRHHLGQLPHKIRYLIHCQRLRQIPREIGVVRIEILPQHMEALQAERDGFHLRNPVRREQGGNTEFTSPQALRTARSDHPTRMETNYF